MIRASDVVETDNERQTSVNFLVKWEGAQKQSTLTIMKPEDKALKPKKKNQPSYEPKALTEADTWTPILAVDCRGLEPTGFNYGVDEFVVESEGGSKFGSEVDFSDEWCEYCEKNEEPVGVSNFEHRWTAL